MLQNIDTVADIFAKNNIKADLRGLIDSAWYVDNGKSANCKSENVLDCQPQLLFKAALK